MNIAGNNLPQQFAINSRSNKMFTFIKRVIKWNSLRYEQEHNSSLTIQLLSSELDEFRTASFKQQKENKVDQIDALVDITYIAIGAMWKLGLNEDQIFDCLAAVCDANDTKSAAKTESHIKANIDKGINFVPPEEAIKRILANGN